jgi:D-alanine-D-alanine ligase
MAEQDVRVAVLMGGASGERNISISSGTAVADSLEKQGFRVDRMVLEEDKVSFETPPDVAFIAMHGPYGEDGGIQRDLEVLGIAYTGSGVDASSRAMDKHLTKELMKELGIPTPEGQLLKPGSSCDLPPPVVLKPTREGSSLGLHFAKDAGQLESLLRELLSTYPSVLAEERIDGRELTVGILGEEALPIVEIAPKGGRYDFKSKYTKGMTEYTCPACIEESLAQSIQEDALKLFTGLGCRGFARADVLLTKENQAYFLEINTIPGLTETSLLPKAAATAGIPFDKLIRRMLELAL